MNWKKIFKVIFFNILLVPLLAALALGLLGYSAEGMEGFWNGATWGAALGVISVPFGLMSLMVNYWGGFASRFGAWFAKEESERSGWK